jgi:beta-glucuronidase
MLYPQLGSTREVTSLDGIWEVAYDPARAGISKGYPERMPAGSEEVAVPASLNEQVTGSEKYNYMDWVWYFRRFEVPAAWHESRVFLRFGSVNYRAEVFLNGKKLGEHQGGYMPFEFEISDALKLPGKNLLAVRVDNLLDNCTIPQGNLDPDVGGVANWRRDNYPDVHYDFFPFTGIHRPVTLYTTGKARLEQLFAETLSLKAGKVRAALRGRWSGKASALHVAIPELKFETKLELKGRRGKFETELRLSGVKPWSPKSPRLYEVRCCLLDGDEVLDSYALDFGFRTFTVRGDKLLLNDKPVYMRGFGRHEDSAIAGKGLNLPYLVKDFNLMKWIGANSYRTSHYPYSEQDMQMADRQGFLVIDEAAANTLSMLAATSKADRARLLATHKAQLTELVERDFNHPSVIMWSIGNECETYKPETRGYFKKLAAHVRKLDPRRLVTCVLNSDAKSEREAEAFDVICLNTYPTWYYRCGRLEEVKPLLKSYVDPFWKKYRKPILMTEFGADAIHGMHSEYDLMWSEEFQSELVVQIVEFCEQHPHISGAHIWNFADFKVGQHTHRVILNRKGVFTRDRTPKLVAREVRKIWRPAASR